MVFEPVGQFVDDIKKKKNQSVTAFFFPVYDPTRIQVDGSREVRAQSRGKSGFNEGGSRHVSARAAASKASVCPKLNQRPPAKERVRALGSKRFSSTREWHACSALTDHLRDGLLVFRDDSPADEKRCIKKKSQGDSPSIFL